MERGQKSERERKSNIRDGVFENISLSICLPGFSLD